jgi:hypothetical protein
MSDRQLINRLEAISTMSGWSAFAKAYSFSAGYHIAVLNAEINNRWRAVQRGDVFRIVTNDIHCPTRYFRDEVTARGFINGVLKGSEPPMNVKDTRKFKILDAWKWNGTHWLAVKAKMGIPSEEAQEEG